MRIPTWIAALSSVLLLLAAGETSAQSPDHSVTPASFDDALTGRVALTSFSDTSPPKTEIRGQSMQYGGPPGAGGFQPAYGNNNPGVIWPANTPQSFQPDPAISPFYPTSVAQHTTHNRNGLWFKDILYRNRDYFFNLEYIYTQYRGPGNATVGQTPLPTSPIDNSLVGFRISNFGRGAPAEFGLEGFGGLQRVAVGPGVLPYVLMIEPDPLGGGTFGVLDTTPGLFPARDLTVINGPTTAHGLRSRMGYTNENGTGVMLTGFWGGNGQENFERGYTHFNGIPVTQDLILANTPDDGFAPISAIYGGLPLEFAEGFAAGVSPDTGVSPFTFGFTGNTQKYDVFYQLETETNAFGGMLNVYQEPIYKRKWVTVRPTVGARYLYVDDRFRFRGIDSGLRYDIDGGATGGGAGAGAGGAGGGAGQVGPTFHPEGGSVVAPAGISSLFMDSRLTSTVDSHLAGPEAGFRYDFGNSKNFTIWGQSTFALLANHEKVRISGENIGEAGFFFFFTGENFLDDDIDTRFDNEETHTHASPMFEQSVYVEANVLKYVPFINKVHLFEAAQFQAGYTYTVVGNMARAGDSIKWKAFPDTPYPNIDYQTWSMQNWSLAVHWEF